MFLVRGIVRLIVEVPSSYSCGILRGCAALSPATIVIASRRDHHHCVWLYFRFALSFRDVVEMLAMRGVLLSYETCPSMVP